MGRVEAACTNIPAGRSEASIAIPVERLGALPAAQRDARIISLCDMAITSLNEARDVEEVFGIRNMAEAFATYARKYKAAVEAQNQCQLVVLLAEARIGAELKAAQERGEVGAQGRRSDIVPDGNEVRATIAETGLSRKQAMEARRLAEVGEPAIRERVSEATREGRRPSRRSILNAIPSIAERPPECTRFALWLRTGAQLLPALGDPVEFRALMTRHNMDVSPNEVATVTSFLSALPGSEP